MDEKRLEEIKERAEKASPGPWKVDELIIRGNKYGVCGVKCEDHLIKVDSVYDDDVATIPIVEVTRNPEIVANMNFIAHAREDIPELIETIDQQQKEIEQCKKSLKDIQSVCYKSADKTTAEELRECIDDVLIIVFKALGS